MENDTTTAVMWTTEKDMTGMTTNATTPMASTTALPLPPFLDHGLSIVLVFAFIFGIAGNGAAIMIFVKTKSLRTPPNMLIVNLAISDFGMVITNFPLMFASTIYNRWLFGDIGCQFYAFCGALFGIMSIANMTAIALDRYYVICWSLEAVRSVTHRRSMIIILIVWAYAIFWSIPPFFGVGSYVLEGYGLGCTFDFMTQDLNHYLHVSFLFASSFVVPVTIIVACFTRIAVTVRKHRHELNKMRTRLTEDKDKKHKSSIRRADKAKTEFQIAKVGFQVTIFYILSWLPYSVVAVIGQYFDPDLLTPLGTVVPVIFAKCSAIWNPIIYCLSHEKFNAALKEKLMEMCGVELPSKHRSMGSQESSVTGRRGMHRQNSSTLSESSVSSTVEQDAMELKDRKQGPGPATVRVQQEKGEAAGTYRRNPEEVTFSKDTGAEIEEKGRGDQGQRDDRVKQHGEGQMDQWSQPPPAAPGVNDKEYLTKM
ncbi:rhodopsin-like [Lytechinus variegatus]|uniref:rhodopsin-like n=1 Tax=Lytechinus variegatus TaxID=7654 RepID=UPI001BB1ED34|nr:rhodopsin-like [Lytechinus variegatus]